MFPLTRLAFLLTIVLAGCSLVGMESEPKANEERGACTTLHLDRVIQPDTTSLVRAADLIIVGTLGAQAWEYSRSEDDQFIHTAHDYIVEELLAGGGAKAGDTISVLRTVCRSGEPARIGAEAALVTGQRYLLLLAKGDRVYWPVSGAQGSFLVENGRLKVLTHAVPTAQDFEGKWLEEVAVMIEAAKG